MNNEGSRVFVRVLLAASVLFSATVIPGLINSSAQTTRPVLFSEMESTRAIAIDSVTSKREPFKAVPDVAFSSDNLTRVMLFAGNLRLAPGETFAAVTADAEDESHNTHLLTVEYVGPLPEQNWA